MSQTIDRETLKRKIDGGDTFHLVEVLPSKDFEEEHLPGAINVPLSKIGRVARERFEPNDEIVVYCRNPDCMASPNAAKKLDTLGFENVLDYEGGKADWKAAGYPTESGPEKA